MLIPMSLTDDRKVTDFQSIKFAAIVKCVSQSIHITKFWNLKQITLSYVSAQYEKVLTSGFQEMSISIVYSIYDGNIQLVCKVQCVTVTLTVDL